jgi:antibiotic biosynthesis monooxygenase (ABM) superfamily enzyme
MLKKLTMSLLVGTLLTFGAATLSAQTSQTAPKSVIHVVTVKWKPGTTPAQIQAALDGVQALPKEYKGITRVWTNAFKVQGDKTHAIVMEFVDRAALEAYSNSAAQKKWYEVYVPIREQSTTFDITN